MTPRKHKHGILYRIFLQERPIEGGGYKTRMNLATIIILVAVVTGALAVLQWCGALDSIGRIIGNMF